MSAAMEGERGRKGDSTDETAREHGRRVVIRVPCVPSVCLGPK